MGENQSYLRDKKQDTIENIIDDRVTKIGFLLGQRDNDILRHTSIVFSLNSKPRYVIDFGAQNSEQLAGVIGKHVFGDIRVHDFESAIVRLPLVSPIAEFEVKTEVDRKNVQRLCKTLIYPALKDFDLLKNNCHHYVLAAYGMIVSFKSVVNYNRLDIDWDLIETAAKREIINAVLATNQSEFVNIVKELMENDLETLKTQYEIIAGVGGGVGGTAVAAAGGGLLYLSTTTGITATAGMIGAGVATGGIAIAAAALGIAIGVLIKVRRETNQRREN